MKIKKTRFLFFFFVFGRQVPAMGTCDPTAALTFNYTLEDTKRPLVTVAHASGDRSEGGCLTLTMLYDWLATEPTDVPVVRYSSSKYFTHG